MAGALRTGFTTGSCAAAAAQAAVRLLLTGVVSHEVEIDLPRGGKAKLKVEGCALREDAAAAWVIKDAGDDPDITDGARVEARVSLAEGGEITIDGGEGIGRVTLPGLDQPVGAAAINSVPRRMILNEAEKARSECGHSEGLKVIIAIPGGEALARRTFNERLGIQGGLSVLGTSGIVEPMSEQALLDSLRLELRVRAALGRRTVLLTPGNYGRDFIRSRWPVPDSAIQSTSNFIGDMLDGAAEQGFSEILLVGHLGKLVKLAANMFNTHSRYGDGRMEVLTAQAAAVGLGPDAAQRMLDAATVDAALSVLDEAGIAQPVLSRVLTRIEGNIARRLSRPVKLLLFTNARGALIQSEGFQAALDRILQEEGAWYTS